MVVPAGLASVFSINGGMAPMRTAFANTLGAVAADIACDLPAACRVADMDCVFDVELLHELSKIVGVGIQVVAVSGLARTAVSAAVMGDAAVATGG
jgi:hypothetical protein